MRNCLNIILFLASSRTAFKKVDLGQQSMGQILIVKNIISRPGFCLTINDRSQLIDQKPIYLSLRFPLFIITSDCLRIGIKRYPQFIAVIGRKILQHFKQIPGSQKTGFLFDDIFFFL